MPKEEPDNDLCRCCHAEGAFKNLYASFFWMDVEEVVYSKLLQECFDIEMAPITQPLQHMLCTICDTCIERLQEAVKFKRQVQKCEKRFREVYGTCVGEENTFEVKVKKEIEVQFEEEPSTAFNGAKANTSGVTDTFRNMDEDDDGFSGDDDDFKQLDAVKIKKEVEDSDSEDDIVLKEVSKAAKRKAKESPAAKKGKVTKVGKGTKVAVTAPIKVGRGIKVPKMSSSKDDGEEEEELDVIQEAGKEASRKKIKKESTGRSAKKSAKESESDDEELDTDEGNDSKEAGKKAKRKKTKTASASVKKRRRVRSLKNYSGPAEDEEELGTVDGIPVIKVKKFAVRLQKDIDYKESGDKLRCVRCPVVAKKYGAIVNHIKSVHFHTAKYRCPICYDHFWKMGQLIRHNLDEHGIDQRYKCKACDKSFFEKTAFTHHIESFHMVGDKFKCEYCEFETYNRNSLNNHKRAHLNGKVHKCQYCQKAFTRRTTMIQHERIHTGDKRKVCGECGQAFVERTSLKYHMTKHHPGVAF